MPAAATRRTHVGSDYDRIRARHVFQRDAYLGGEHFRNPSRTTLATTSAWTYGLSSDGTKVERARKYYNSYLVAHAAESDESFEERLARACYLNLVAPIVDSYAESVTAHVSRKIPESYGAMTDVDLRGSAWGDHAEEVARWAALHGYLAVVYDAPAENPAQNRAEEIAQRIGPRVITVPPLSWAWVEVDDDGRVTTFAWVEQSIQDETGGAAASTFADVTVRVVTLTGGDDGATAEWQVRAGRVAASSGLAAQRTGLAVVARGPLPAALEGELPVVFAYFKRLADSRFPMGQPVADDACDIARSIYGKLSEEDELHGKAGFPFLAIPKGQGSGLEPETRLALGAGRGLAYEAGAGAPTWVQPSSESSKELRESVVFRAAMAFRLAGIEVATDQSGQAESGVALRVRARGFEARAKRFANAMARYERQGLALWKKLAGATEDASVEYAKRFTLPDPTEDLAAALQLLTQMPVEIGVEAKVAATGKALEAVLALSDEKMQAVLDEIRGYLTQDVDESNAQREGRMQDLAAKHAPPTDDAATNAELAKGGAPDVTADEVDERAKDPTTALNGAQVASLLEIVQQVATRMIPRETGLGLITASFPLAPAQADKILGAVGRTFFAETAAAPNAAPTKSAGKPPPGGAEEPDESEPPPRRKPAPPDA
jgi:hypothetical protein